LQLWPTGDGQGAMIARHQPVTLAAMEGLFHTQNGAPLAILGQPDVASQRLDNPLTIPSGLSFLTYRAWTAEVKGLDEFPRDTWPDNIELVYFSYHIMVGLGTIFIAIFTIATLLLWRRALYRSRAMLWIILLALPFPFIANTAGWITAEVGRQPWLVYGLLRTTNGASPVVSAGNAWFTLIGFMGVYTVLGILFLFLVYREIERGPERSAPLDTAAAE
jgi:cytochrome d ubiquinol oxidase subunit I